MSDQSSRTAIARLETTWKHFREQVDLLDNLSESVDSYHHKLLSKPAFLGAAFGHLLGTAGIEEQSRYWSDSIDALVYARIEAKKPFSFYGGATPCACAAILSAYQDMGTLLVNWPGLTDLFDGVVAAIRGRVFPDIQRSSDDFDPEELFCRWVNSNADFRQRVRAFPGRALCRSLKFAFREINLSRIASSATQEYVYARKRLCLEPQASAICPVLYSPSEILGAESAPPRRRKQKIPSRLRTRPLSLAEAAHFMGYRRSNGSGRRQLRNAMDQGAINYERLGRQQFVFSLEDFPKENWNQVKPTRTN